MKDGEDEMTVAMRLGAPGVTNERYVSTRTILDTTPRRGNPIQFAGSVAERWRDLEAWESLDVIEAFITAAAQFIADVAAGEPTWEDAAWQ
jgi:hypothetical protein